MTSWSGGALLIMFGWSVGVGCGVLVGKEYRRIETNRWRQRYENLVNLQRRSL